MTTSTTAPALDPARVRLVDEMRRQGATWRTVAGSLDMPMSTLYRQWVEATRQASAAAALLVDLVPVQRPAPPAARVVPATAPPYVVDWLAARPSHRGWFGASAMAVRDHVLERGCCLCGQVVDLDAAGDRWGVVLHQVAQAHSPCSGLVERTASGWLRAL